jgi:hypothetical protein
MKVLAKAGQDVNNSLVFCLQSPTWTVCGRELLSGDEYVIGCINWIINNNTGDGDTSTGLRTTGSPASNSPAILTSMAIRIAYGCIIATFAVLATTILTSRDELT